MYFLVFDNPEAQSFEKIHETKPNNKIISLITVLIAMYTNEAANAATTNILVKAKIIAQKTQYTASRHNVIGLRINFKIFILLPIGQKEYFQYNIIKSVLYYRTVCLVRLTLNFWS